MSNELINKNLGHATAYAYAVEGGYVGTEEEFSELLGSIAEDLSEIENLSVTVTTLPAGSSATASYDHGVLALGIPKGDKGDTGETPSFSMGTVSTLPAGSDATASITGTDENPVLNLGLPKGADGDVTSGNLAQTYSSSSTYAVGDYCFYSGTLYRCITAITTAEAWTAGHWTVAVLGNDVSKLKNDLSSAVITEKNIYNSNNEVPGCIDTDGSISTSGNYAYYKTSDYIPINQNDVYSYGVWDKSGAFLISMSRKILALYNANKVYISGSRLNNTSDAYITIASQNAVYIKVSYDTRDGVIPMLSEGPNITSYSPYGKIFTPNADNEIKDIVNENTIEGFEFTRNMFDVNAGETGLLQSDGTLSTSGVGSNYITSDFILIEPNKTYKYRVYDKNGVQLLSSGARKRVALYTDGHVFISGSYIDNATDSTVTINTGGTASYMRVSFDNTDSIPFLYIGDDPKYYIPFGCKLKSDVDNNSGLTCDILNGKYWAVCGDSFTAGTANQNITSGKYTGKKNAYPYIIGNRTGLNILPFFQDGKTLAYPSSDDFFNSLTYSGSSKYYQNIPEYVDYITIYLGINDSHHENGQGGDGEDQTGIIPLGTINDNTVNTYYGAWNVVLTWLLENRPNAHIGIIVSNGCDRIAYPTAMKEIAQKYGIPFIDLNGDERTPAMIRTLNPNISDAVKNILIDKWAVDNPSNTHPNDDAHEFESTFIEAFLRSI